MRNSPILPHGCLKEVTTHCLGYFAKIRFQTTSIKASMDDRRANFVLTDTGGQFHRTNETTVEGNGFIP
jgi:hypothetical protein